MAIETRPGTVTSEQQQTNSPPPWTDFAHVGPGTLAGRYLRRFWHPVLLARDLPPGRAKPVRIMGEDFTLYRGEARPHPNPLPEGEGTASSPSGRGGMPVASPSGRGRRAAPGEGVPSAPGEGAPPTSASSLAPGGCEGWGEGAKVHAVAFRCAHRGTQLSTGWVEGDNIRCFYHGWVYGPDGQCVEQPAEPEPFCNRIRIRSYPVEEYLGLIFVYLGEGDPPPMYRFPELEGEGILENSSYTRMCNYFNQLESNMDEVHVAFVHRASDFTTSGLNRGIPTISGEETEYGVVKCGHREGQPTRTSHFFWPNALMIAGSTGAMNSTESQNVAWRVPVDDYHHKSFNVSYLPITGEAAERYRERQARRRKELESQPTAQEIADMVLHGEAHADDFAHRPDAVGIQDNVAQAGQGVIIDKSIEHLGRSDNMLIVFRRIWERELRALAEGRPLKEWRKTGPVLATYGV